MKFLAKLLSILSIALLVGCTTPGVVHMPHIDSHDLHLMQQKKVAFELTYQAPESKFFYDGEMQDAMPIKQAKLNYPTRSVVNDFNQILAGQIPTNALVIYTGLADYKLTVNIKALKSEGPVVVENLYIETFFKDVITLGLAPSEQQVAAEFEVTYTLKDVLGKEILVSTYEVNERIDHERSDYEVSNSTGDALGGELFRKHLVLTLNEFVKELAAISQ